MKSLNELLWDEYQEGYTDGLRDARNRYAPCKIGDRVWAIRSYKGIKHPQEGIVSEMFFVEDMRLMIVVKNVARGVWGETVFGSYKEADKAIEERKET
jgi:hypothetical protein